MNRTILTVAGVFGASSLLLVDSAVKGTALLVLAAVAAIILRRDSAATRHFVWLLAIVAMLAVSVLAAMLPQWRVLPEWADISAQSVVVDTSPTAIAKPAVGAVEVAQNAEPDEVESPSASAYQPAAALPDSRPALVTPEIISASAVWRRNWLNALPLVWAIGFCVLILRLLAARWMLWNTERHGTVIRLSTRPANATHDTIVTALEAMCLQLGIGRPVTLLIHPDKTIPVVWGILRCCLLLPAAARQWSGEQLRSVLLHELAHIKRRDTLAQLLAQIACAVHWFNPLVWFAAWRLGVERERACDDLVLASGVRPSAYAGHLLDVVTGLSPARWTQSCGLAMARQSSLEGRLVAVLSENLNRRGVSVALAAIALAIAVGIAVPIAMLRAADQKPAEKAKPATTDTKPKDGAKLQPGSEEKLRWGEPVNGLRAAIVIRNSTDEPKAGEMPELYLAVQNVSDAPIRLNDTLAEQQPRMLYIKIDGKTQAGIGAKDPRLGDLILQPRDVAFLLMYSAEGKILDGHTTGQVIAEGTLKDTHQTLVAQIKIEKAPEGAWTGKLVTGETSGAVAAGQPQPKDKEAQALFQVWQDHARRNGDIPGGLVGRLGDKVKEFIRNNTGDASGDPYAKKMAPLVPRFDAARDWTPVEAVALLDDIAAVSDGLLWLTKKGYVESTIRPGAPLPPELANAPWGEAQPNGLRLAWMLEPRAEQHRLGTALKSRIYIHNSGKGPVVFRTHTWHQSSGKARDAQGADINVSGIRWTTIPPLVPFWLAPGEYIELTAPGIGVGKSAGMGEWADVRVGSSVLAKEGDEVTFTPGPVSMSKQDDGGVLQGLPRWWLDFIAERLNRELPLPADAAERTRLLECAVRELFGTAPTAEETVAFVADATPNALDSLAKRLAHRAGITPYAGELQSGPTKFRVLAADPDAANQPRVAIGPGEYPLCHTATLNATLKIVGRPVGDRRVNEAEIRFLEPEEEVIPPPSPHKLEVPDGWGTWAIVCRPGTGVFYLMSKGAVRKIDYSNPAQVKNTPVQPGSADDMPGEFREAVQRILPIYDIPVAEQEALLSKVAASAAPAPATPKK